MAIIKSQPQHVVALKPNRRWRLVDCPTLPLMGEAAATKTLSGTAAVQFKRNGRAVTFNTKGDYLSHGANSQLQLSSCSGVVLCTMLDSTTAATLFGTNYSAGTNGLTLLVSPTGGVQLAKMNVASIIASSNSVPIGTPMGIAWSYDSDTGLARLAVNGVLTKATSMQTCAHNQFVRGRYYSSSTVNSERHDQHLFAISAETHWTDAQLIADSLNPWGIFADSSPRNTQVFPPQLSVHGRWDWGYGDSVQGRGGLVFANEIISGSYELAYGDSVQGRWDWGYGHAIQGRGELFFANEIISGSYDVAYGDSVQCRGDWVYGNAPLSSRCDWAYGDYAQGHGELVYGDAIQRRWVWGYANVVEGHVGVDYDVLPAVKLYGRGALAWGDYAMLSGRGALVWRDYAMLSGRAVFCYDIKTAHSGRCGWAYDLDAALKLSGRAALSYGLLLEPVAQVRAGLFTLRTRHG